MQSTRPVHAAVLKDYESDFRWITMKNMPYIVQMPYVIAVQSLHFKGRASQIPWIHSLPCTSKIYALYKLLLKYPVTICWHSALVTCITVRSTGSTFSIMNHCFTEDDIIFLNSYKPRLNQYHIQPNKCSLPKPPPNCLFALTQQIAISEPTQNILIFHCFEIFSLELIFGLKMFQYVYIENTCSKDNIWWLAFCQGLAFDLCISALLMKRWKQGWFCKGWFCFAKPLAPLAKDSSHSSFASSRLSRLQRSILALRFRGLFLTDRVKPSLWQWLYGDRRVSYTVSTESVNVLIWKECNNFQRSEKKRQKIWPTGPTLYRSCEGKQTINFFWPDNDAFRLHC